MISRPLIVMRGSDSKIPPSTRDGTSGHNRIAVYGMMLAQICRDYATLPALDSITASDIRWYYDMLRSELRERTKPRG